MIDATGFQFGIAISHLVRALAVSLSALNEALALLIDPPLKHNKATVYVGEGFVCKLVVTSVTELQNLLEEKDR